MTQNEAYAGLADAVIMQAAKDWRDLCQQIIKPRKKAQVNLDSNNTFMNLRRFFKSEWCDMLCAGDPLAILERLEQELKETKEQKKLMEVI